MSNEDKFEYEHVGDFGVDSGLVWIGDPCYIGTADHPLRNTDTREGWKQFCRELFKIEERGIADFGLNGLAISTGYGDGMYPVFVRRNKDGVIVEISILFDAVEYDDGEGADA